LFRSDAGYCVIQTGYGQLIEEEKPDVADMPKEAIHPTTYIEEGDFLPQDVKDRRWHPIGAVAVGLIYGMAEGMQYQLQSVTIAPQLVQCLPYLATLIVLLFTRSGRGEPKVAGKHYYMKGQ